MYMLSKADGPEAPGTGLVQHLTGGMGCAGLGCGSCGGKCGGMGLFDGGFNPSSWTWQEYFVLALGGYVLTSMFFTTRRAARQISEGVRGRVRKSRRRLGSKIAGREL